MATRLYPKTTNRASLETLAGAAAGTYDALDAIKAKHGDGTDAYYEAIFDNSTPEGVRRLDTFLTFGWGKFKATPQTPGYAGTNDNATDIEIVFALNGIRADVALCEGIDWN